MFFIIFAFNSDADLVLNIKACSDSYITVIKCQRYAVGNARIV